jgi:cytochrome P450
VGELIPHFQAAGEGLLRRLEGRAGANLSMEFHTTALDAVLRALFSLTPEDADRDVALIVRRYIAGPGRPNLLDGLARSEDDFAFAGASRRRFRKPWFAAVDRIVAERRSGVQPARRDLLALLLEVRDPETGAPLSDAEIRDQTATMLLAGFETTSRLLFWASYLLALDLPTQARVRAEVRAHPVEAVAGSADIEPWPALREVLLETLRLYPPIANLLRTAVADDEVAGEAIGPGTQVWISPWVIHRHRRFWDQPTAFLPSRFRGQRSPWTGGAFMPFGMGPRICIGAAFAMTEAEMVLASLLGRYSIGLDSRRRVLPVANVTTRPSFEPTFSLERS